MKRCDNTIDMFGDPPRPPRQPPTPGLLGVLRKQWEATIHGDGGHCPVCDRWGRVYWRTINATMARGLIWFCQQPGDEQGWVYAPNGPKWLLRSNQFPTLKNWGLLERRPNPDNPLVKHEGFWRPTALGRAFYMGKLRVPKRVATYNDTVVERSIEETDIVSCFDTLFDYSEVMAGRYGM